MFADEIPYLLYVFTLLLLAVYCLYWSISRFKQVSQFIINGSQRVPANVFRKNKKGDVVVMTVEFTDHNNIKQNLDLKYWSGFSSKRFKGNNASVRYAKTDPKQAYINRFIGTYVLYSLVLLFSLSIFSQLFPMIKSTDSFYPTYVDLSERFTAKPHWQYTSDQNEFNLFPELASAVTLPEWVMQSYAPVNIKSQNEILKYIYSHPKAKNSYQRLYNETKNAKALYYFMLNNKGNPSEVISGLFRYPYFSHDNFIKDAVLLMEFGLERYKYHKTLNTSIHVKRDDEYGNLVSKANRVYMQDKRYQDAINLLTEFNNTKSKQISDWLAADIEWSIAYNYWQLAQHKKAITLTEAVIDKWSGTESANIASRNLIRFKKEQAKSKTL